MVEMGTWRPGWGSRCVASQAYAAATAASLAIRRVEVVWWLFWLLIDALRSSSLSRLNCWYEASHQPQPTQPTQQGVVLTSIMWLLEGGLKWLQTEKLCFYISTTSSRMHDGRHDVEHHPLPQHTATSMTATSHNDAERTINDCHFTRSAHGPKRTVSLFSFEAN